MPQGLRRFYGTGDLHFITCSCHDRQPFLHSAERRNLLLQILEEVRQKCRFVIVGYVVMPEHFHLLMSEPQQGDPSFVMQILKQRSAQKILARPRRKHPDDNGRRRAPAHIWQPRFYDFNLWNEHKRIEKLRYMHRNPVKRGLVAAPEQWAWSSFRYYKFGEPGPVSINDTSVLKMRVKLPATTLLPAPCKKRKERGTRW